MVRARIFALTALLLVPASARAAYGTPDHSNELYPEKYGRPFSFEGIVRMGIADAGSSSPVVLRPGALGPVTQPGTIYAGNAAPYTSAFALDESLGWRIRPVRAFRGVVSFSSGLDLGMRLSTGSSSPLAEGGDGTSGVGRLGFHIGTYFRVYVRVTKQIEWWVGSGFGYMLDRQKYTRTAPVAGVDRSSDYQLTHHGLYVPLRGGVMVGIDRNVWIGPSFDYSFVGGAGACAKISGELAGSHDLCQSSKTVFAHSYGVWSLGFDMRVGL